MSCYIMKKLTWLYLTQSFARFSYDVIVFCPIPKLGVVIGCNCRL